MGPNVCLGGKGESGGKRPAWAMAVQSGSAYRLIPLRGRQSSLGVTEKLRGTGAFGEEVCRTRSEPEKEGTLGTKGTTCTEENYGGARQNTL